MTGDQESLTLDLPGGLELHLSSPPRSAETNYTLAGTVRGEGASELYAGGSVRVRSVASGLVEEAFLDERGCFSQELTLAPDCDNALELTLCDTLGGERATVPFRVRHGAAAPGPGQPARVEPPSPPPRPAEPNTGRQMEPPWKTFAQLVRDCLILAGDVAERTGRDRQEWFEQVYAQERFAEQAFAEHNQELYRECLDNLGKLNGYLERLGSDHLPSASRRSGPPTLAEARGEVHRLRNALTMLTSAARARRRGELQERLAELSAAAEQLLDRAATDAPGCLREVQRLWVEHNKVTDQLAGRRRHNGTGTEGLLEGSV